MKAQKGFSLIELVVTLVILAALAVTAIPRFLNLSEDARIASLESIQGMVKEVMNNVDALQNVDNRVNYTTNGQGNQIPQSVHYAEGVDLLLTRVKPTTDYRLSYQDVCRSIGLLDETIGVGNGVKNALSIDGRYRCKFENDTKFMIIDADNSNYCIRYSGNNTGTIYTDGANDASKCL